MCEKCKVIRRRGAVLVICSEPRHKQRQGRLMARIAGVNIPLNKRVEIGLTYVFGIGRSTANKILEETGVDPNTYVKDLTEDEVVKLREAVETTRGRGRPAPRALAERQAPDGDRLLPRPAPPPRPAGPRPAHQDQRARPQGPAPDERRRQARRRRAKK